LFASHTVSGEEQLKRGHRVGMLEELFPGMIVKWTAVPSLKQREYQSIHARNFSPLGARISR
jgi:hypothetical protein